VKREEAEGPMEVKRGFENSGLPETKRVSPEENGGPSAGGRDRRRKELSGVKLGVQSDFFFFYLLCLFR
jgi:hypothetical protein